MLLNIHPVSDCIVIGLKCEKCGAIYLAALRTAVLSLRRF